MENNDKNPKVKLCPMCTDRNGDMKECRGEACAWNIPMLDGTSSCAVTDIAENMAAANENESDGPEVIDGESWKPK